MGRKNRLKREIPNRHELIVRMREGKLGGIETFVNRYGAEIALNPIKRFLKKKPYKNHEFHNHMMRTLTRAKGNIISNPEKHGDGDE